MEHQKRNIIKITLMFVLVLTAILLVLSYFFSLGKVNGSSMANTLKAGDLAFVINNRDAFRNKPERGDIISFESPVFDGFYDVKRVIGIPGDEIKIESGKVYLNGEELKEDYIKGIRTVLEKNQESHWVVPEGKVFVLGDNREKGASMDSRSYGFIDIGDIEGYVKAILYPEDRMGLLK